MSPTIFDADANARQKKTTRLQHELEELVSQAKSKSAQIDDSEFVETPEVDNIPQLDHHAREEESIRKSERHHRTPSEYSQVLSEAGKSSRNFSAFIAQPTNTAFETQQMNEKILLLLRQHPIVNLKWIVPAIALFLAPGLVFQYFPLGQILSPMYGFFFTLGWYLFVFTLAIQGFLDWYYNIYIITDERIIDVDFYSLIYRSVSEAKLDKIEDVTAVTAGISGTLFDFGNITIQTAAEKREFEFANVPQPSKVTKFLNELMVEEEQEKLDGRAI